MNWRISGVRGLGEQRLGRPLLPDPALVHEHGDVGDAAGEAHLVGDEQHGHAVFREPLHHPQHLLGQLRVECRGHLVEQHHLGPHGERAGDGDPLLLAARELVRIGVELLGEAHELEHLLGDRPGLAPATLLHDPGRQHDVLADAQMREQIVALEHDADVGAERPQVARIVVERVAGDRDVALADLLQPVDAAEHRALARAAAADQRHDLARLDRQRDPFQDLERAEALVDVVNVHLRHGASSRDDG